MTDSFEPNEELKHALAAGDERAFSQLLEAMGPRLHRAAYRMLCSQADADDALQDVFVAVVKSRHRLSTVQNLNAYLFTTLHHVVGRLRTRKIRDPNSSDTLDNLAQPTASDPLEHHEEALNQAIQQLSEKQPTGT